MTICHTARPVNPAEITGTLPEFGRLADVSRVYSLKRETTRNLLRAGKIKSVLLHVKGQKGGIRLFDMASIRDFIHAEMEAACD